jgi:putative transposase
LFALVAGDSADHNQQKVMTVSRDEFLRRFLLHLLPKGFVRIRHFGFLANRRRAALLPRCFAALHATPPKNESETSTAPTAHQRHNSNSVLHRSWPRLHEITHPHTALSARFRFTFS